MSPETPGEKDYACLVKTLKDHFNPKPSEIVQRFKFNTQTCYQGESIADYVAELRKLVRDCNYGTTLLQMLRDRLVCEVNDDRIQRRLLSHRDLDFDKAWEIAQSMQSAKDVRDIQAIWRDEPATWRSKPVESVYKLSESMVLPIPDPPCFRCRDRHTPSDCRFASETCHGCGKKV